MAVTVLTTEHFTLQGARAATISESTGRATMFLGSVSGGLVALGLVATAVGVRSAFFAIALVLLPTLVFVWIVTFDRVLQSGIEDYDYERRIVRLRDFYFDAAPELTPYLMSAPVTADPRHQRGRRLQLFLTVAGMVAVITAVLAGSAAGILAAAASGRSLAISLAAGALTGLVVLTALTRFQSVAWRRAAAARLFEDRKRPE